MEGGLGHLISYRIISYRHCHGGSATTCRGLIHGGESRRSPPPCSSIARREAHSPAIRPHLHSSYGGEGERVFPAGGVNEHPADRPTVGEGAEPHRAHLPD